MSNKMPLRIMTQDFRLLGQISKYESLQITSEWSGIGEIELHINRYMKNADKLTKGNIIFPHGRLDRAFVIEHREIALDEAGKITENWIIKAPSLKSWFADKLTIPESGKAYIELNADAETVMHSLVEATVINPVDPGNKIENLILDTNQKRGDRVEWQSRYKYLAEELEKISFLSGIGWNIVVDRENERFIFRTYEGLDLTEHNADNPPAIFSPEFKTIQNLSYSESMLDYKNYAIVAGQGEGADRRIIEVGDPSITGTDRRVLFVDARDVEEEDENGNALPIEEIERKLRERGEQKLAEHAQEVFLEGQALGTVVRKRDTSVNGVPDDLVLDEVSLLGPGRNVLEKSNDFSSYSAWGGSTYTYKTGIEVPEWATKDATEITMSGGTLTTRFFKTVVSLPSPEETYTSSVWLKNTGLYTVRLANNLGGYFDVNPGESTRAMTTASGNGRQHFQLKLESYTADIGKPLKIILWRAKVEEGSIATPWQPAPEDVSTWYQADKTVHLEPINLSTIGAYTDSLFNWVASTPAGTEAHVEYSLDNRNWQPLGDSLPFTRNQHISGRLFIRIRLLTSDQTVTPSIRNFRYVINGYKVQGNPTLGRLTYGIDYNLGDMVTLQSKDWGVSLDARITAVKEIYEPEKQAIELTFGNDRPTIFTKIKQELEGVKAEITR